MEKKKGKKPFQSSWAIQNLAVIQTRPSGCSVHTSTLCTWKAAPCLPRESKLLS